MNINRYCISFDDKDVDDLLRNCIASVPSLMHPRRRSANSSPIQNSPAYKNSLKLYTKMSRCRDDTYNLVNSG